MSKCIDCGSNFVGTPEQPPPEGMRCKSCEIKRLKSENARLAAAFENVVAFLAVEKERCKTAVEKCKKEGDTHGENFHQGMFSGFNQADIAVQAKNIFYLNGLLAPTIELLRQATLRPITWQNDVKAELARLRAITERK